MIFLLFSLLSYHPSVILSVTHFFYGRCTILRNFGSLFPWNFIKHCFFRWGFQLFILASPGSGANFAFRHQTEDAAAKARPAATIEMDELVKKQAKILQGEVCSFFTKRSFSNFFTVEDKADSILSCAKSELWTT